MFKPLLTDHATVLHPQDKRTFPRVSTHTPLRLKLPNSTVVIDLLDLSRGGAKCLLPCSIDLIPGQKLDLVFLDESQVTGHITWQHSDHVGIEFNCKLLDIDDLLHFEHLGFAHFASIIRMQSAKQLGPRPVGTIGQDQLYLQK